MLFKHFGNKSNPTLVLLHGGGLSWWIWQRPIAQLISDYYIIAPIIDGHDIDGNEFISISDSSDHLIAYIEETCSGSVFAIGGFSLGAQIVLDVLGKQPKIAKYAIIESALTEPMGLGAGMILPMVSLSYGLIQQRWFAKLQAAQMFIPEEYFDTYFVSTKNISKNSLINITRSNGAFRLAPSLTACQAKALILVGSKEPKVMVTSANQIAKALPNATLAVLDGFHHGELCIKHPKIYVDRIKRWLNP